MSVCAKIKNTVVMVKYLSLHFCPYHAVVAMSLKMSDIYWMLFQNARKKEIPIIIITEWAFDHINLCHEILILSRNLMHLMPCYVSSNFITSNLLII